MRALTLTVAAALLLAPAHAQTIKDIIADFDGDGKKDVAGIDHLDDGFRIIARLTTLGGKGVVIRDKLPAAPDVFKALPPGSYTPRRESHEDVPVPVTTNASVIYYGSSEASDLIAYWNGKAFIEIALTD